MDLYDRSTLPLFCFFVYVACRQLAIQTKLRVQGAIDMDNAPFPATEVRHSANAMHTITLERMEVLYARIALGGAFLSAVADRFGLWGRYGGWGNFANFTAYTAQVNSFMPASVIPFLARAATAAELSLGILLIVGLWPRWVALASSVLLFLFGLSMAISFGLKSPLDYSVFSASAGALLLAQYQIRRPEGNTTAVYADLHPAPLTNQSQSNFIGLQRSGVVS